MDDIKKNPFLSAYTALLVIGAAVLGFFAYKAYSGFKEASSDYTTVRSSVDSLKGQDFYPNEKNRATRTTEVEEFSKQVVKLESQLAPFQPTLTEDLSVPDLQGLIRKNIEEVRDSANLAGVTLGEEDAFRLGMAEPLQFPPRADAVPGLEFQLIAARQLAELLINSGIDMIDSMGREALAVEKPPVIEDPKAKRKRNTSKANTKEPLINEDEVIERYPLIATITGDMASMRNVLNNLASTPEGSVFFSTRYLRLENQSKEGPDKEGAEKPLEGEEASENVTVVLGNEALKMQLMVDATRFVSREEAEAKAAAAKEAAKNKKADA